MRSLGHQITPFALILLIVFAALALGYSAWKYSNTYSNKTLKYKMMVSIITSILSLLGLGFSFYYKTQNWKGWFLP